MALLMPKKVLIITIHTLRNQLFLSSSQQLQKKIEYLRGYKDGLDGGK